MNLKEEEDQKDMPDTSGQEINQINQEENNLSQNADINPIEDNSNDNYLNSKLTTNKWRVKLYRLNKIGQWDDCGIGFVFCITNKDETGKVINKLIMISELTEEEMLNIDLDKNTSDFHNQRGTIMTWKTCDDKGDDNIAISFQEKEGVKEIMKNIFICEGKNINDENIFMDSQSENYFEVSIQNLPNLVRELNFDMGEQKLNLFINYLKNNNCEFITQLGDLLKEEEKIIENLKTTASSSLSNNISNINGNTNIFFDKTNNTINNDKNIIINENNNEINNEYNQQQIFKSLPMENIHYIFTIFKNLILLGDKDLIEILIKDDYYLITFGALEYDFETMKTIPHRKYFKDYVKFENILNIKDENILNKINQNLRLTYLRDTALSRLIDDKAIKTINLILQLNHNDIIQFFLNDLKYFEILFNQLQNEDININKKSCQFLSELIECSKDVLQSRTTFCECLFEQGILSIIGKIIEEKKNDNNIDIDNQNYIFDKRGKLETKELIRITAVEIFINILTMIPNIILDYLKKENDHKLLKQITNIMLESEIFGIKYEISQIFKTLIETQTKEQTMDRMELFAEPFQILLNYLKTPILGEEEKGIPHKKKIEISSTKQIIIEILITWFSLMSFNKQFWIDEMKLNDIIINLLEENDKIINLHSIKLLKCIIEYVDPFVCNRIINEKLCNNLVQLFNKNIKKNNIIISCMMDFFELLSKDKQIIFKNLMTYQSDFFYQNKKYFKIILLRYENKPLPKRELMAYINNDYKDNESLLFYDFDYKDSGEIYDGEDEKVIDYLSKKREREEYNDEYFDNFTLEHEHKKYNSNNDYYNNRIFGNKDINFDDENDNEDDIKKNNFLPDLSVNESHDNNNDDDEDNFHY